MKLLMKLLFKNYLIIMNLNNLKILFNSYKCGKV